MSNTPMTVQTAQTRINGSLWRHALMFAACYLLMVAVLVGGNAGRRTYPVSEAVPIVEFDA